METNTIKYNNYIVTFIDVMGFTNLIEKRYKGNAAPIVAIIKEFGVTNKVCGKYVTSGGQEKEVTYHAFSDSIIRKIYIEENQLSML